MKKEQIRPWTVDLLIEAAKSAQKRAYAPYSKFKVGAAVVTSEGTMFSGANVENRTYGLTVCAERNAIMQAVFASSNKIVAIAIVGPGLQKIYPCGMCLQVLAEFCTDCDIILGHQDGFESVKLSQLLPFQFLFGSTKSE